MRSTVAILGTGLIGTSLGLALKAHKRSKSILAASPRIVGWDVRPSNARAALRRGGITKIATSMEDAVRDASVIVIAAPLDAALELAPKVIKAARKRALILDVTPVKTPMVAAIRRPMRQRKDITYVSGHPMAGREKGGAANAAAALFERRPFVLVTLTPRRRDADTRAKRLVKQLGAVPIEMSARVHDRAVAAVSALPQLASVSLVLAASKAGGRAAALLVGPGFEDATRLALSPFDIWRPAIGANRREIIRGLRALEGVAARVSRAARQADVRAMERLFSEARAARKRVVAD